MRPRLAVALDVLLMETNRKWPNRSTDVDGWLGDAAHRARSSGHNPDEHGIVHALDLTAEGMNVQQLVVCCSHHEACWYVISRGILYSRTSAWRGVNYQGVNPHTNHTHIEVVRDPQLARSRRSWLYPSVRE